MASVEPSDHETAKTKLLEKEKPSLLAKFAAAAAIASAVAAATNAWVAWQQHDISSRQYTPQVAVGVAGWSAGNGEIHYDAIFKNVGPITIYEAEVTTGMIIVDDAKKARDVFRYLKPPDKHVTLGPTDIEVLSGGSPLSPATANLLMNGGFAVAGARITFTDELGRPHERYLCETVRFVGNEQRRGYCEAPKQF